MADIAHDGHVFHRLHVLGSDDVFVAGRGAEDVGALHALFHRHDFKAVHRSLQCADRIDFGYHYAGAAIAQRRSRTLADVSVTGNAGDLAGQHHIGGAADGVDQRFLATIQIVELRLGHGIVHVDRGERQLALLRNLVKAHHARGRFLGHALDILDALGEIAGLFRDVSLQRLLHFDFFGVLRIGHGFARFQTCAPQREHGCIAAIVQNHIGRLIGVVFGRPVENAAHIIPVIRQRFALDGEHRNALIGNRCGGVILGGENVAGGPADFCAQCGQRFDQHGGLDRHMQRTGNAGTLQRLRCTIFFAQCHQARHFRFGNRNFVTAILGKADVFDDVVFVCSCSGHNMLLREWRGPRCELQNVARAIAG